MSRPLSREFLLSRGYCCGYGCLNCPYPQQDNVIKTARKLGMEKTAREESLLKFAEGVLEIMESHTEWGSDTTDEICDLAYGLDLAETGEESLFTVKR